MLLTVTLRSSLLLCVCACVCEYQHTMGGAQSNETGPPPLPRGQMQAGFVPGGQAGFVATAPPGIKRADGAPNLAYNGEDIYALREIPSSELQGAGWGRLDNEIPVYVAVDGMGTSLTGRVRLVGGVYYYAVHKVFPLNPENNVVVMKYYEVPHVAGGQQLVFPMKYAITQLWPAQNTVVFVTDDGGQFRVRYNELLRIKDRHVSVAVAALKKDYPNELDSILSFRPVETPQFDTYDTELSGAPSPKVYTTLSDTNRSKQLFNALNKGFSCPIPKKRPVQPPTVTIPTPACGFDNGVPSLFDEGASATADLVAPAASEAASKIGAEFAIVPHEKGEPSSKDEFAALLLNAQRSLMSI